MGDVNSSETSGFPGIRWREDAEKEYDENYYLRQSSAACAFEPLLLPPPPPPPTPVVVVVMMTVGVTAARATQY